MLQQGNIILNKSEGWPFLTQSLGLISSYFFSANVELDLFALGLSGDDETTEFLNYLSARHTIACVMRFKSSILINIENNISRNRVIKREESRGLIYGRLDIPKYINRYTIKDNPRIYPLIVVKDSPETPENALVKQVLKYLCIQLSKVPYPKNTAEGIMTNVLYTWTRSRLKRWPWSEISRFDGFDLLFKETERRIHKRQTGNEFGYKALIDWISEWRCDIKRLGNTQIDRITNGLLAFPQNAHFWDKIFEIWCLKEISQALKRCDCELIEGPNPLYKRSTNPIYIYRHNGKKIEIWFQCQASLGKPRWIYEYSNKPFMGIPDIIITYENKTPLIIDAKYRNVNSETRSEETYKMLGYLENYRNTLGTNFHGILMFIGNEQKVNILKTSENDYLSLIIINCKSIENDPNTNELLDIAIKRWLTFLI